MVHARLQFLRCQIYLSLCLNILPFTVVKFISHQRIDILPSGIAQMERHHRILLQQHLFLEVHTQSCLTVTQRQRVLSSMRLTGTIRHIGSYDEVIEHRIIGLRQCHRHIHLKRTVRLCDGFTLCDLHILRTGTDIATVPISPVGDPPVGPASHHPILHLRLLNGHTGITLGSSLHRHGITLLIIFFIRVEFHLKGRSFVFLHPEVVSAVT